MPVKMADLSGLLGSVNTASFLFGDEAPLTKGNPAASPEGQRFLKVHADDDKFPILVRREGDGNVQLSASSAGLDLALQSQGDNQPMTDRATAARHRQSLPPSAMRQTSYLGGEGALNGILTDFNTAKNTAANRRSLEVKFSGIGETKRPSLLPSPQQHGANGFPKLQSSYSTNDIPTLKSTNAINFSNDAKPAGVQSTRHEFGSPEPQATILQNLGTPGNRQVKEAAAPNNMEDLSGSYLTQRSGLHASAAPFGPPVPSTTQEIAATTGAAASPPMNPYGSPAAFYGGYGMQMLTGGFNNMYLGNNTHSQWPGQMAQQPPVYPGAFGGYNQFSQPAATPRFPDSQSRAVQQRRAHNGEGTFVNPLRL